MTVFGVMVLAGNTTALIGKFNPVWAFVNLTCFTLAFILAYAAKALVTHQDRINATMDKQYGFRAGKQTAYDITATIGGAFMLICMISSLVLFFFYLWSFM